MKIALIILTLLATTLLQGCVVVPAWDGPYYGHHHREFRDGRPYGEGYDHRHW